MKPEGLPFPVREALCFERQAQLSPLPFLAALLPELTVYEHSPVRDIRGHAVRCDGGTVTAEQIVVATHFPMLERFGLYDLRLRQENGGAGVTVVARTGADILLTMTEGYISRPGQLSTGDKKQGSMQFTITSAEDETAHLSSSSEQLLSSLF